MIGQVVIFALGNEEYAIPIEVVREITLLGEIRSIPQAPAYVQGLINIRSQAIPVVDLHVRFGIAAVEQGESDEASLNTESFALITEVNQTLVGFSVDRVLEVRTLEDVDPPPPLVTAPFIGGLVNLPDRIIILLDPKRILEDTELQGLSKFVPQ
ncbi:chemotaxis protein CheW [Desulfosporosinus sp.]|uniref:chemotaxis protein CheW n=1 Tax=Desulfosporosinus sp. TaxID=157907 RepID=UPI000E96EA94|nr:chemotaxis protein CheW [Desulfosporosinus sp.]MBC2724108.1 purine-binding chemotaxis protein CheW [Desulfosporosinus sp.]MBC2728886.1 purine-binding chemotaxis protein CheW [Desulfosporosinus sp.]HBV85984.1 chemotaxis protein CheW [Desulfosporosinus sp.]